MALSTLSARAETDPRALLGGGTTVFDDGPNAFALSARNLRPGGKRLFAVGNALFNDNWVIAPASTTARDGLGPLFNARSCSACHFRDGRTNPFTDEGQPSDALLFRLAKPGDSPDAKWLPDSRYGSQLQPHGILNVPGEGNVRIAWTELPGSYPDGTTYTLRRPSFTFENGGYGPMDQGTVMSPRAAPTVVGMGLLEAIPTAALKAHADPDDADGDGVSGRMHILPSGHPGIFGWKAEQKNVDDQVEAAFLNDLGVTSPFARRHPLTDAQTEAKAAAHGGDPEIDNERLQRVAMFYTKQLAVPARRDVGNPTTDRGEEMFAQIGCATCHVPTFETGQLIPLGTVSYQTIFPYTDLLLHDMGEDLADGQRVGDARENEFRTPPLWGLGLVKTVNGHEFFLHDGRANGFEEAILWHGGEGAGSRDRFKNLPAEDRAALLAFLKSL